MEDIETEPCACTGTLRRILDLLYPDLVHSQHTKTCALLICYVTNLGQPPGGIWADANNYTRRQDSYFRLRRKEIVIGMSTLKEVLGLSDFRNHLSYSQKHVLLIVGT